MEKILEYVIDESTDEGVFAVSLVEYPAIKSDFVALSAEEVKFADIDREKRIVMGAALIPNKLIYRESPEGEPFYMYFSEDTVRKTSELYFKKSKHGNATIEHAFGVGGITAVEAWIVDNPEMDKSKHYGLIVPKGTWMLSMKIDNDQVWDEYVKSGRVKGFSIEGTFSKAVELKEVEEEMSKEDAIQALRDFFSSLS